MTWQKKLAIELLWFATIVTGSFVLWYVLSHIIDQNIIVKQFLYGREKKAFLITIGVVYFLRVNTKL